MTEKSQVKRLKARPQKNSGRGKHKKGDATKGNFLIDVKEYGKSYSVTQDKWAKVSSDAWLAGNRTPSINLVLGDESKTRLLIVPEDVGIEMMELYNEKYV